MIPQHQSPNHGSLSLFCLLSVSVLFHFFSSSFFSFGSHSVSPFSYSVSTECNLYFYKWDSGFFVLLFFFFKHHQGICLRVKEPGYHRVFAILQVACFCILIQGLRTDTHKVGLWSWKRRDPTGMRINIYLYLLFSVGAWFLACSMSYLAKDQPGQEKITPQFQPWKHAGRASKQFPYEF